MKTFKVWVEIISLFLIVIGALLLGLKGALNFDLMPKKGSIIVTVFYCFIGLAAIIHLLSRDYYLPFLGHSAFPCGSLVERIPTNADKEIVINVEPNVNVIYWAAESNKGVQENPWVAYQEYANAGVARSDKNGYATLKVRDPAIYKIPSGRQLKPHIHYRTCHSSGLLSRVETINF